MVTTGLQLNASLRENREGTSKREWVKPEIEIISKDIIRGGTYSNGTENFITTAFGIAHGALFS